MAGKRKRVIDNKKHEEEEEKTEKVTPDYEQLREQRIKENKERMQNLGILEISLKLKADKTLPRNKQETVSSKKKSQLQDVVYDPPRRSSRLKDADPVCYTEVRDKRSKSESSDKVEIHIEEGSAPEIYTKEDEKLLGDCKEHWTLNVDGFGSDGKRIYDSVEGESCHQCRQKTLGHRTNCSRCKSGLGQFCGDCLYIRYGENVVETKQNSKWVCPRCRGICNCSRCRKEKGWMPTGAIYSKVKKLGFKSVAHYLIQTQRIQESSKDLNDKENSDMLPNKYPDADNNTKTAELKLNEAKLHNKNHGEGIARMTRGRAKLVKSN